MRKRAERGQKLCGTGLRCDLRVATFKLSLVFFFYKTTKHIKSPVWKRKKKEWRKSKDRNNMIKSPAVSHSFTVDQRPFIHHCSESWPYNPFPNLTTFFSLLKRLVTDLAWNFHHSSHYLLCQQSCQLHSQSSFCSPRLIWMTQKPEVLGILN